MDRGKMGGESRDGRERRGDKHSRE